MNLHPRPRGRQWPWLLTLIPALLIGCQGTGGNAGTTPPPGGTDPGPGGGVSGGVVSLSVGPGTGSIPARSGLRFLATALDKNGQPLTNPKLNWLSSNAGVLLVDATGAATAVTPGSATVTVSADGKTAQASITVTPQSTAPAGATWQATAGLPSYYRPMAGADGTLYDVAVDLNSVMLLASTDRGASFQARSSVTGGAGSSVAISPDDPKTIWVGSVGSVDGGHTWTRRLPAEATSNGYLNFTPGQPGRLTYAIYPLTDGSFTSTDGGQTWTKLQYSGVTWSPTDANIGVALDSTIQSAPVYHVTTDGGAHWAVTTPGSGQYQYAQSYAQAIAIGPDGMFWAVAPLSSGGQTLVQSVNNGVTWSMVSSAPPGVNWVWVSVSRSDSKRLFLSAQTSMYTSAMYTSANGGSTWTPLVYGAQVASLDGKILVASPTSGSTCLQRSTDGGQTWSASSFCPVSLIDFWADQSGQVLARTGLALIAFSTDGGATFTTLPARLGGQTDAYGYVFNAADPAKVLAISSYLSVSSDAGATWGLLVHSNYFSDSSRATPPQALILPSAETLIFGGVLLRAPSLSGPFTSSRLPWLPPTTAVAFNPAAPATIYAATSSGFYRSTNDAVSWSWASNGIDHVNLSSLAVSPDGKILLASSASGQAYRSTDNGDHWSGASIGLKTDGISSLSFAKDSATAFAAALGGGVYRSLDGGLTWEWVVNGLRSYVVNSVAADPSDANMVYAATGYGVYKSLDKGSAWTPASKGLILPAAKSLGVSNDGRTLYVTQCSHYMNYPWPPVVEDRCGLFTGAPSAQTGSDLAPLGRQPLGGALR